MMILVIALPSRHLGGIGLDLMAATLAPHDQPDFGGNTAECHRRAEFGFHL